MPFDDYFRSKPKKRFHLTPEDEAYWQRFRARPFAEQHVIYEALRQLRREGFLLNRRDYMITVRIRMLTTARRKIRDDNIHKYYSERFRKLLKKEKVAFVFHGYNTSPR